MTAKMGTLKNYTYYDYEFEKTTVRYVVMNDSKSVFMLLIPNGMQELINDTYETVKIDDGGYSNHKDWMPGSIVHLHLSHHMNSMFDNSFKFGESIKKLKFDKQECLNDGKCDIIKTYVKADEGYGVCHILKHYEGENGFEVNCIFTNNTGEAVTLEMISSASLDALCPFGNDDGGSRDLLYHYFKGGWSIEGKPVVSTISQLNLDKSWGGSYESEKIGSIGSKTIGRNYPYAAIEDTKNNCTWGIKLKHNATWQIELTRYASDLSLSAGLGDLGFGAWSKTVNDGQSFETPVAYIAVSKGGIDEVSNDLIKMNDRDIKAYDEKGMPIMFNEWCTNWGNPTHERLIGIAKRFRDMGSKIKYFIVDDGWQNGPVGNWDINYDRFPNGIKAFAQEIRDMGMIPGIWMEFEALREGCAKFNQDEWCLKKLGEPIKNGVSNSIPTKFLDFRNPEVIKYLDDAVIGFLKENQIGYMKVDYNANIGLGCDGADSLGEGLREHMEAVYAFFKKVKEEIPEIIIENCSSGGSRLEPKMMSVTAMSSFSDAHECFELPTVAANMHYLISPKQSQIWCVLKENFDKKHMSYIISAGFLGRLCWSGNIDKLSDEQISMMSDAEKFYEEVSHIIEFGRSVVFRTDLINNRFPEGTQAVVRYSDDMSEALVVCHFMNNAKTLEVNLRDNYFIEKSLYPHECTVEGNKFIFNGNDRTANVFYLKCNK